jgi:hypothetical protein
MLKLIHFLDVKEKEEKERKKKALSLNINNENEELDVGTVQNNDFFNFSASQVCFCYNLTVLFNFLT